MLFHRADLFVRPKQVPIVISLSGGGVTPATLRLPPVAVLLRLSLACYLQVPLSAVLISGAASTDATVPELTLAPGDPPNAQAGFCAQVVSGGPGGTASSSAAPATAGAVTTVSLIVLSCVGSSGSGVPPDLQALLDTLSGSAAASPPPSTLFAAFLAAASASTSGPGVTAATPIAGPPGPHPSPSSPPPASPAAPAASAAASSSMPVAVIGGAAGGGGVLLMALCALLLVRRRRSEEGPIKSSSAGDGFAGADAADASFVNRMHSSSINMEGPSDAVPSAKGVAAVAAFKVSAGSGTETRSSSHPPAHPSQEARRAAQRVAMTAQAEADISGAARDSGPVKHGMHRPASRRPVVVKTVFAATPAGSIDAGGTLDSALSSGNPLVAAKFGGSGPAQTGPASLASLRTQLGSGRPPQMPSGGGDALTFSANPIHKLSIDADHRV